MPIYAIPYPTFQKAMRIISSITNANPATVVTTFAHQYDTGLIVRLIIPPGYGMLQANQLTGTINVIDNVTFTINIDTTTFDTFVVPAGYPLSYQQAQVVPIAEVNELLTQATQNVLPYP